VSLSFFLSFFLCIFVDTGTHSSPEKESFEFVNPKLSNRETRLFLKVHKNENVFGSDFEFCTISLLVMLDRASIGGRYDYSA
jgi:hypothetical protein